MQIFNVSFFIEKLIPVSLATSVMFKILLIRASVLGFFPDFSVPDSARPSVLSQTEGSPQRPEASKSTYQ